MTGLFGSSYTTKTTKIHLRPSPGSLRPLNTQFRPLDTCLDSWISILDQKLRLFEPTLWQAACWCVCLVVFESEQQRQRLVLTMQAWCGWNVFCASSSFLFKCIDPENFLSYMLINSIQTHRGASEVWDAFYYRLHQSITWLHVILSCSYGHTHALNS